MGRRLDNQFVCEVIMHDQYPTLPSLVEPARSVPVVDEVDVCVIGGGCTGVCAAVAAARLGARVALIERNGFFGGVATAGLVNIWHSLLDSTGEQTIIRGLTQEIIDRLAQQGGVNFRDPRVWYGSFHLNTEMLKLILDAMVVEAGVHPFLHAWCCGALQEADTPIAVVIEDKSGRRAVRAAVFIDASGDGDFVRRCGGATYRYPQLQPPTTCAVLRGLHAVKAHYPAFDLGTEFFNPRHPNALRAGALWSDEVPGGVDETLVAGTRVFDADCSDADQLTQAEIEGRRQVGAMCEILRTHFPLDAGIPLVTLPAAIGIRETLHVRCRHQLTQDDLLRGVRFSDAIANGTYPVDIHHADKPGITMRFLDGTQSYNAPGHPTEISRWLPDSEPAAPFYQIPYRALVPVGVPHVLIAGRLIDADQGAFGAVRVMVNCNQMGQAAGVAAALACRDCQSVGDLDPVRLRAALVDQGAVVW